MTTEASQLSRRNFLYLSLATAVAGVASGCRVFSFGTGSPLEQALAAVDLQAAQVVCHELAAQDARFKDKDYLTRALSVFEPAKDSSAGNGPTTVSIAIVADFRARRTVKVAGWVLSITEAQIIALKALGV